MAPIFFLLVPDCTPTTLRPYPSALESAGLLRVTVSGIIDITKRIPMVNRAAKAKAGRKRRSRQNKQSIMANKETEIRPQKIFAQPKTDMAFPTSGTQQPGLETKTKIRIGPTLILTCSTRASEVEAHWTRSAEQARRSKQQCNIAMENEACLNGSDVWESRIHVANRDDGTFEAEIRKLEQEQEAEEEEGIEEVEEHSGSISRSALMKELERSRMAHIITRAQLEENAVELNGVLSFFNQSDLLSGADVINLANSLNADILQGSAHIADTLNSSTSATNEVIPPGALQQADMSLGRNLANALRKEAKKPGPKLKFLVQVALQVCMVTFCVNVIHAWSPDESEHQLLERLYTEILARESQAVAGRWRSLVRNITEEKRDRMDMMHAIIDTITDILLVAGCWKGYKLQTRSRTALFKKFHQSLDRVVDGAMKLQTAVGKHITCMDITPLTIRPGISFDRGRMEGAYAEDIVDDADRVLCTTELGLERIFKGSGGTHSDILLKPTVILQSTIED